MKPQACLSIKEGSPWEWVYVSACESSVHTQTWKKYLTDTYCQAGAKTQIGGDSRSCIQELHRFATWKISSVLSYGTQDLADESGNR